MDIFCTTQVHKDGLELFSNAKLSYEIWNPKSEGELTREIMLSKAKNVRALITGLSDKIDAAFLNECKNLKIIANYAVGHNNIDSEEAKRLGIVVTNTPDVLTEATAEGTVALILATIRKFRRGQHLIDQGKWTAFDSLLLPGIELKGKTLGMLGLGRIGARVAEICEQGFGMKVIYTTRAGKSSYAKDSYSAVSFDELISQSDILSVLCPLNNESRLLFTKEVFKKMKKTSYFINSARGEIHNEKDLYEALSEGLIAGAGLDVYNPEPIKSDSPLLTLSNVYLTPHIAACTHEARSAMTKLVAENIIRVFNKQAPLTRVN